MLTVAEALELDAFTGARVVAGQAGLNRTIRWVHNVGVPDAAQWLNGGELALTTIINMPPDLTGQCDYLREIIAKEVVGLVVTIGHKLDHLPKALLNIADEHDFPLIEIFYKARYVDMARAANERIIEQNMALVRRALTIQQRLTQLVLEGGGIKQLAETLAALINQSVSIETDRFDALASVNLAPVDEARRYTQRYGRTDPRLVRALEDEILPEIRRTLRPVFIPQMPHVGLEMERILAPIVVHGQIYGYVWIIADDRPVSELDHMAIESGATIAALMLLYQESIQSAESSLKGNLLTRLIQGEINGADVLTDQALRYGVDLRRPFRLILIEEQATAGKLAALYRRINRRMTDKQAIVGQFAGQVVILAQENGITPAEIAPEDTRVGVSAVQQRAGAVAAAYAQCREALEIAQRLNQAKPIAYFDHLGYLLALYRAGPQVLADLPYVSALRDLTAQPDLCLTLETYLDAGGNGAAAAEELHIHRSTLNYRLQRLSELCQADLSDPATRLNLQIALKLLKLFG